MKIEQFVMAYSVEQDRIRAMLPKGFVSLRPVLRINTEIRDNMEVYLEFNTPVAAEGKHGWLNIAHWDSTTSDIHFQRIEHSVIIESSFFHLSYSGTGIKGGCPAEKDNDGCFFPDEIPSFRENEVIIENKEFCDCEFFWHFHEGDANGKSIRQTIPAFHEDTKTLYPPCAMTAQNAAAIPCRQVLGTYIVRFIR